MSWTRGSRESGKEGQGEGETHQSELLEQLRLVRSSESFFPRDVHWLFIFPYKTSVA